MQQTIAGTRVIKINSCGATRLGICYIPAHAYNHTRNLLTEYPLRLTYHSPYGHFSLPSEVHSCQSLLLRFHRPQLSEKQISDSTHSSSTV